jgi:1,4-alpha-glucan branching enzyme
MINLAEVGAFPSAPTNAGVDVRFGIYLPGIDPADGYGVSVRLIHKDDRFVPEIKTLNFPLCPVAGHPLQLWQARVTIPVAAGTNFGRPGTYLYRYQLLRKMPTTGTTRVVTRWFTDPFARMTDDVGQLSAFLASGTAPDFAWTDEAWKVPELEHLLVYELQAEEFNNTFSGIVERLPYLKGLGVTCLELMPVTSQKVDFDWGYGPLHYFAPNERWGGGQGLRRLVNACHNAGVAVILDVVYQHVDPAFPYHLVYADAGLPSPMIGQVGPFGPQIDYRQDLARNYVMAANLYWLHEYHVDGFRYDEVTDLYDGPTGVKYAKLAYDTYNESLKIARFTPSGGTAAGEYSRIIQVPEALNRPQEILRTTYSNATWQDGMLGKAEDMARFGYVDDAFVHLLDPRFCGYPDSKTVHDAAGNPVEMPVAPFQYLDSHDHSYLVAFVGTQVGDAPQADRSKFYKLQPFAIALYTCQGTPMLWEGQEFAENYILPASGDLRVHFRRNVHWEYFYDDYGGPLVRLYRVLGRLRHTYPALRSRESFYDNVHSRPADGMVVYHRRSPAAGQIALIFLNFSDTPRSISVPFPEPGTYREMIDHDLRSRPFDISVDHPNQTIAVDVPSNYGYVFVK